MTVREDIDRMVNLRTWAVVGASSNPDKFGYKIVLNLHSAGYVVYPVNPTASEIAGIKAYPSLADLPEVPDVVDVVVPPQAGIRVVEDAVAKGVSNLWFQPGSESAAAVDLARSRGMAVISDGPCAMVERKQWV